MVEGHYGLHKYLSERLGRWGEALWTFVACSLAIAVSAFAAHLFKQPLFFPSLGPTVYLFFESPMTPMASPRNTVIGHCVAVVVGWASLATFDLFGEPSVFREGVTLARAEAGTLSVALTGTLLLLLRSSHPPAGATVLIVSLGLLRTSRGMLALMASVVTLTIAGWVINRAVGTPVPIWKSGGVEAGNPGATGAKGEDA